jgi:hypothetical protein
MDAANRSDGRDEPAPAALVSKICRRPEVTTVSMILDARVRCRVLAADGFGSVGRGIVRDDELEVPLGLGNDRFNRLRDEVFAVEYRQSDAHPRRLSTRHRWHTRS